jgi:hypothetical protein
LVVAIVALVIALTGTAWAAKALIRNSSQIAPGVIKGSDVADHSIGARDIDPNALASAVEAARKETEVFHSGEQRIATLANVQPGTYAIFGKTTIGPPGATDPGLLGALLKEPKTGGAALCRLNAVGDEDVAIGTLETPGTSGPTTLHMQLTRTIDKPGDVTLTCNVGDIDWKASDTSIIAIQLNRSSRTNVTG